MTYGDNFVYTRAVSAGRKEPREAQRAALKARLSDAFQRLPDVTQRMLADRLNRHETNISLWTSGPRPIPWKHLLAVEAFLEEVAPDPTRHAHVVLSPSSPGGFTDVASFDSLADEVSRLKQEHDLVVSTLFDIHTAITHWFDSHSALDSRSIETGRPGSVRGVGNPAHKKTGSSRSHKKAH